MTSIRPPTLYSSLYQWVAQTIPDACDSRLANLLFMMMGVFLARSVHLDYIARKLPIRAKRVSTVKRLKRFLSNPQVRAHDWFDPFARWILCSAGSGGKVHLIMDSTRIAFGFRLVMVSVAYRRRSLPLAWTWALGARGQTATQVQIALLKRIRDLLPKQVRPSLVGDCEFGRALLIQQLRAWDWDYALRQPKDHYGWWQGNGQWQPLQDFVWEPGGRWLGWLVLTYQHEQVTHLVTYWRKGHSEPWFLATNQPSVLAALRLYRRRMWIEEMFGDFKDHGFQLESSHLRSFRRLNRLTLVVALLYLWLVAVGRHLERSHQLDLVDRHDRHDLSIFRWGSDFIERCFALSDPFPDICPSNFCLVSGS
jgi:hypothetical protein